MKVLIWLIHFYFIPFHLSIYEKFTIIVELFWLIVQVQI